MRLSTSLALAALGLAASALPAAAGTLLVPKQFPTIQKALDAAKPYDTVLVSPKPNGGVYSEAVVINTPHVVLQGQNNPVIDGKDLGTVVHFLPGYPQYDYTVFPNGVDVHADHVAVRGLTVQGFASSPTAVASAGINVGDFVATGNFTGSEVSFSDIEISGNTLQNNAVGLAIQGYVGGYGATTYLKGYRVLGNLMSGNYEGGAVLSGASILVSGNKFTGSQSSTGGGDGLDVTGVGLTVSGNESGGNGIYGMKIVEDAPTYNPAVNDPKNPNPDPAVTAFNYIHDNGGGIQAQGTQTISGNVLAGNLGAGIELEYADYTAVLGNAISGNGSGIYVGYDSNYSVSQDSGLKISLNQISGNAGDGIFFYETAGGVVSLNNVTGNQGVGIHLSDYTYNSGYNAYAPTVVTQNRALHNTVFDAQDDASAPDGDNVPTVNIWTKNVFGTTDPVGLGK